MMSRIREDDAADVEEPQVLHAVFKQLSPNFIVNVDDQNSSFVKFEKVLSFKY